MYSRTTAPKSTATHDCGIDCQLVNGAHIMFPATPNRSSGRYQAELNLGMNRRQYRASGQDESRPVRTWNLERETARAMLGTYRVFDIDMGAHDLMGEIYHGAGQRSVRRILAAQREFFCSDSAWEDFVSLVHRYVNLTRAAQKTSDIPARLTWNFQSTIASVEVSEMGVDQI